MAKDLVPFRPEEAPTLSEVEVQALESIGVIPPQTPLATILLFARVCKETSLSPFKRQIYIIRRGSKFTLQTGIDGFRVIAESTGQYAGSDDTVFDNEDRPQKGTVTIWKMVGSERCPFTATARWEQYYPGDAQGFMWKKMPHLMLGKCAEALALRKAFPGKLGGLYTTEEMEQAGAVAPKALSEAKEPETASPASNESMEDQEGLATDAANANALDFTPVNQATIAALTQVFREKDVHVKDLREYLGHDLDTLTPFELEELRKAYAALESGRTWSEIALGDSAKAPAPTPSKEKPVKSSRKGVKK